jgi:rRNA maturation protein Nop10
MKITCDHCGEDTLLSVKKFTHKKGKTHKIEYCQNCGSKLIVPLVKRFSDDEELKESY